MNPSKHLEAALAAAAAAAEVIRAAYGHDPEVRLKADHTPVTDADIEAERVIRAVLEQRFPGYGFYGEESGARDLDAEHLWLVDPIDGTKAFIRGYPMFSTQIALMKSGRVVLGVSSAPVYRELAWAERGSGAWLDGRRLSVSQTATLEAATVSAANIRSLAAGAAWPAWGRIVSRVNSIRGYGDFLHYHLLAAGCIDAAVESDVSILDVAALSVIVEEAGGVFTALDGAPLTRASTSVLAANPALHALLLAELAR